MNTRDVVQKRMHTPQRENAFARVKSLYGRKGQEVVAGVVAILYCDREGRLDRDKEWSPDTLEEIAGWLASWGLLPRGADRGEQP